MEGVFPFSLFSGYWLLVIDYWLLLILFLFPPQKGEERIVVGDGHPRSFADALHYIADPAFLRIPAQQLLSKEYAKSRAALIMRR